MTIRVDVLIYLYTALCACILLFDLFYAARKRWRRTTEPKQTGEIRTFLLSLLQQKPVPLSEKELRKWSAKLSSISTLLCFHEAVKSLLEDKKQHDRMMRWLQCNKDLLIVLGKRYIDKSEPFYATYFAYLVGQYRLCTKKENDRFVLMMQQLCLRPSLYCRENALCALYACGRPEHVVKAYLLLAQRDIEHSAKLVTDGLLQFAGDKNALAEHLWRNWDAFPPYYQVCFINFIRIVSGNFCKRFHSLLAEKQSDPEVLFAAIRYFRTHQYSPIAGLLQQLVIQWDADDWEFAAIAAHSLEAYQSPATVQALLAGCRSTIWHVRENASDSLMQLVSETALQEFILVEEDNYAKDMLQYKLLRKRLSASEE